MLKKICYAIVIAMLFAINIGIVKAENKRLATCTYYERNESKKPEELQTIDLKYELVAGDNGQYRIGISATCNKCTLSSAMTYKVEVRSKLKLLENQLYTEDDIIMVPELYRVVIEDQDYTSRTSTIYEYISDIKDGDRLVGKKGTNRSVVPTVFDLARDTNGEPTCDVDDSALELYKGNTTSDDWATHVCYYGSGTQRFYLMFNSNRYESNIYLNGYNVSSFEEQFRASKYDGECPPYLCSYLITPGGCRSGQCWDDVYGYRFNDKNTTGCMAVYSPASEYRCGELNLYMKRYNEALAGGSAEEVKLKRETVREYCNYAYKTEDYMAANSCIKECMTLGEDIFPTSEVGECGLSTKIVVWIENILRWIKYIIPVMIIMLSILDFIKAIAADKEDEMKKAQKHFKIRLIIAVMIFLLPILIEFILGKMGFDASNCGIDNIGF